MNKQTKAILNILLIFTGAALVGWLLGKISLIFTAFMVQTFGAAYIVWCTKLIGMLVIFVPAWAGILALVKRYHTHPRVMAALDMSKAKV